MSHSFAWFEKFHLFWPLLSVSRGGSDTNHTSAFPRNGCVFLTLEETDHLSLLPSCCFHLHDTKEGWPVVTPSVLLLSSSWRQRRLTSCHSFPPAAFISQHINTMSMFTNACMSLDNKLCTEIDVYRQVPHGTHECFLAYTCIHAHKQTYTCTCMCPERASK